MLKNILTSTALATLLASGAYAQATDQTTTDPLVEEDAEAGAEAPAAATDEPAVADDPAMETDEPAMADDPATEADEPAMADDPATETDDPAMADDPAAGTDDPAMATDPAAGTDDPAMATDADPAAGEESWDAQLAAAGVSADDLIGSDIVNHEDETIATVDDILVTDTGEVEGVVARFGGFLGFGSDRVLLQPDELQISHDENENIVVRSDLTPEALEGRPAYEEADAEL